LWVPIPNCRFRISNSGFQISTLRSQISDLRSRPSSQATKKQSVCATALEQCGASESSPHSSRVAVCKSRYTTRRPYTAQEPRHTPCNPTQPSSASGAVAHSAIVPHGSRVVSTYAFGVEYRSCLTSCRAPRALPAFESRPPRRRRPERWSAVWTEKLVVQAEQPPAPTEKPTARVEMPPGPDRPSKRGASGQKAAFEPELRRAAFLPAGSLPARPTAP
jgi:hypothetical protein